MNPLTQWEKQMHSFGKKLQIKINSNFESLKILKINKVCLRMEDLPYTPYLTVNESYLLKIYSSIYKILLNIKNYIISSM